MGNKKILIAVWACENKNYISYGLWQEVLKRIFKETILFDPQKNLYFLGKEAMNKKFLEIVAKEMPDFILFWLRTDEFDIDTLLNIRKISPKTKTINFFGDDESLFDNFTRYYSLFFDACLMFPQFDGNLYEKNGIKNYFFTCGSNLERFKPLRIKKKYDVTFAGIPKSNRYELARYLIDNGINLKIFGPGWYKHKDLSNFYMGPLDIDGLVEVTNQSKINLCFTKNDYGVPHLKGRVFDCGACRSFALVEESLYYLRFFESGKEIVMAKNKKDFLNKIRYYLENEGERERIAENMYRKMITKYDLYHELMNFFNDIKVNPKKFSSIGLPKLNKAVGVITKELLQGKVDKLRKTLKEAEYIVFYDDKVEFSYYKTVLQAFSLEKTKKDISCCDYYLSSKQLGDYFLFPSYTAYHYFDKRTYSKLLDKAQMMVTKDYFLDNLNLFNGIYKDKGVEFINEKNTAFVSVPLVKILRPKRIKVNSLSKLEYNFKVLETLAHLVHTKKLLSSKYIYHLVLESLHPKKIFIVEYLTKLLFNKNKMNTIRKLIKTN